jgi:uncharacterized protein YndB with AHSA1/START domain
MITVQTTVNAPVATVWKLWSEPAHIKVWNTASPDWHTPVAENDLREGGTFKSRMEAKDKSMGFDFGGTYTKVVQHKQIDYTMGDGRKVTIAFEERDGKTSIVESFDPESQNPPEMQQQGWQSIMDNFKKYTEAQG